MKDENADITFIAENERIPAHKLILSVRSSYFSTLINSDFAEAKQDEIELKVPLNAFKAILKYIYTGCLELDTFENHLFIEIYDLAERYEFDALKKTILEHLKVNLTLDHCVSTLNAACLYSVDSLQSSCMHFMDCHSVKLLDHDTFKTLSLDALCTLLKRDSFYAKEIDIFKAIVKWSINQSDDDIKVNLDKKRNNSSIVNFCLVLNFRRRFQQCAGSKWV